jgi:NitT/TauT family transport system substrate-binding protein
MLTRNFRVASAVAVAIMCLAAGCDTGGGSAGNAATTALEEPNITIAAVPSVDLAGFYIAEDDGFFKQQGLNVKLVPVASSKAIIAGQLAGKIDICAGAYMPYISAEAAGAKFRILAEGSVMAPGTRVLLVPSNSHLTSIDQLVGKKIGLNASGSIGALLISALLEENGISPHSVTFITDPTGFPTIAKELHEGAWQAAFFAEPYATKAQEQYGDTVLADLDQGAAASLPISGYMVTQAWAQRNPRTAAAFTRAIEAAQTLADTDQTAVRTAMSESDNLSGLVTDVMAVPNFPTGKVDVTRIQDEALAMVQFGMIKSQYDAEIKSGSVVGSMVDSGL